MEKARGFGKRFAEWTTSIGEDVSSTFVLLTDEKIAPQARRQLAGALSYLLTRLDLIPDHEPAGAVDDAMVLRVAYGLAAEQLDASARAGRLINEEDAVREFLGDKLFARLRRYVSDLADKEVRGRKPDKILSDARARADMKRELDETLAKVKPPLVDGDVQEEALERSVMNYLKAKLVG